MRGFAIGAAVVVAALAAAPAAGDSRPAVPRASAGAGITVLLPPGLHLIRRSLTDVTDPAQRLAASSFPVRLAAHPCECGTPNVADMPRSGAFVFVWEYRAPRNAARLSRVPRRPAHFRVGPPARHWFECAGPSWTTGFREAGRVLQVDVYLGPATGRGLRARVDALLDSLRVVPQPAKNRQL